MSLTSFPPVPAAESSSAVRTDSAPTANRRQRRRSLRSGRARSGLALVGLLAGTAALVPAQASSADPAPLPVVGSVAADCAPPPGFARPAGAVPPGYIYNPTLFDGVVRDPQPDDTFATTAAGHAPFTGQLRTRVANGREELLVCAHVGTNVTEDGLTPFPMTTGTNPHPATIAPQVSLIDAAGTTITYTMESAGLTDLALAHYAGSTDPHEGVLQMWVPFPTGVAAPGFTVRTEIRGKSILPWGGTALAMGADEVFVHLGGAPLARNAVVNQAVGLAIDDSAIAERPSDPGPDDLRALVTPMVPDLVRKAAEKITPYDIPDSFDWSPSVASLFQKAPGRLNSVTANGSLANLDIVDFDADESRLQFRLVADVRPDLTLRPRSIGLVSIISGSCHVTGSVRVTLDVGVTIDLNSTNTKPKLKINLLSGSATTSFVNTEGDLWALGLIVPFPMNCRALAGDIKDGLSEQLKTKLQSTIVDPEVSQLLTDKVNESTVLDIADLANGPLSDVNVPFGTGRGFDVRSSAYVPTAPPVHQGGRVHIWNQGVDVAASLAVTDLGGTRFPYSVVPGANTSVEALTHNRSRPGSIIFDPTVVGQVVDLYRDPNVGPTPPPGPGGFTMNPSIGTLSTAPLTTAPATTAPLPSSALVPSATAELQSTTAATTDLTVASRTITTTATPVKGELQPTTTTVPTKVIAPTTPIIEATKTATAPVVIAPSTTTKAFPGGLSDHLAPIGDMVLDPNFPELIPTDFDLGLIVNGATVNQLSRALTAGGGEGTGILDIDAQVVIEDLFGPNPIPVKVRPAIAPIYLPTAPAGWSVPGAVKLYVPSARVSLDGGLSTMAVDVMAGAGAKIDESTNHLVPTADSSVAGRIRFLRLNPGVNVIAPGDQGNLVLSLDALADLIGPEVVDIVRGVQIPNLSDLLANGSLPNMVIGSLSLATTGGGHLGIYFNVNPNPAKVVYSAAFSGPANAHPSSVSLSATPTGFPGSGSYSVRWTVKDLKNGTTLYSSPAGGETSLSKTVDVRNIGTTSWGDQCQKFYSAGVRVFVEITRNGVTNWVNGTSETDWEGPINEHFCGADSGPEVPNDIP